MRIKGIISYIEKTHFLPLFCGLVSIVIVTSGAKPLSLLGLKTTQNSKERKVTKVTYEVEPFIVSLKVNGIDREIDKGFTENGNWIKDLSITIKNTNPKPIIYIGLDLMFPETASSTHNQMGHQLQIGQRPGHENKTE